MVATLAVKQWGNSLGVRIPARIAREVHLHVDSEVCVSVEGDRVVLTPVHTGRMSLAERLAAFDPARHGGEAMAAMPVGAESW